MPCSSRSWATDAEVLASSYQWRRELEHWTYQTPVRRIWKVERRELRGAGRLRHHRADGSGTGPSVTGVRRRRPRHRAGATACRSSTRSAGTGTSAPAFRAGRAALFFKDADEPVLVADLRARGLLFRHVPYEHAYPHCWRCHTPLMYYALAVLVRPYHRDQGPAARRERADQLVPADDQARPLRRLARQQHRLGPVPRPLLGYSPAGVAQRQSTRPEAGLRRVAGRARRSGRRCHRRTRPAPAVRRRRHLHRARWSGRNLSAGAAGDRRLVRLRLDALRPVRRSRIATPSWPRPPTRPTSSARRSTRPAAGSTR